MQKGDAAQVQDGPKNRTYLSLDNLAIISGRKACDICQKFQNVVEKKRRTCIVVRL